MGRQGNDLGPAYQGAGCLALPAAMLGSCARVRSINLGVCLTYWTVSKRPHHHHHLCWPAASPRAACMALQPTLRPSRLLW